MSDMDAFYDIKGFEGLYRINKKGEIWSCCYKKIMKPHIEDGYVRVKLRKDGKKHMGRIHRLLGIQFIDNPDNLPQIDHIDRNRSNNSLDNLRWVSQVTNRLNRSDIIADKTPEELAQREIDLREYKRVWAEKNRREKGTLPKMKRLTIDPEHKRKKWREARERNKDKISAKAKEDYDPQKQRDYLSRKGVKEMRNTNQQAKRNRVKLFRELPLFIGCRICSNSSGRVCKECSIYTKNIANISLNN